MTKPHFTPGANTIERQREQIFREWLPAVAARRRELARKKQQGLIDSLRSNGPPSQDALPTTSAA